MVELEKVNELTEGDTISVPQYENLLQVTYIGMIDHLDTMRIGIEFVENKTDTLKAINVNLQTEKAFLQAGRYDKGEVKEIEIVD